MSTKPIPSSLTKQTKKKHKTEEKKNDVEKGHNNKCVY